MCPAGGIMVKTGIDKNRNNILDSSEVDKTKYVCNGQNGQDVSLDKQICFQSIFPQTQQVQHL